MTNTKFRKRALLSSVAMLLVALVALGSATFAWFSTTNNASASAMRAKTDKSSNILLSETGNGGWVQDLTFTQNTSAGTTNGDTSMLPVTTKNFTNWYTVEADKYNQGYNATKTYEEVSNIKTQGKYAKYTTLFIQNNGETGNVQISATAAATTGTDTTGIDYVRVALVPIPAAGSNATQATTGNKIFGSNNDRANAALGWNSSDVTGQADTIVTGAMGANQVLGSMTKGEIYGYDVYVYFEGTDFDCVDQYAGGDLTVSFAVSLAE